MADEKPKTVTMESIEWHTYNGKEYPVGATYELDPALVESVTFQGKAVRADRAQKAKDDEASAEKARKERSKLVAPMTTDDLHAKPKK